MVDSLHVHEEDRQDIGEELFSLATEYQKPEWLDLLKRCIVLPKITKMGRFGVQYFKLSIATRLHEHMSGIPMTFTIPSDRKINFDYVR